MRRDAEPIHGASASGFSRRRFLELVVAGTILAACGEKGKAKVTNTPQPSSTKEPTPTPKSDPSPTPKPSPTPEATPTPEVMSDAEISQQAGFAVELASKVAGDFPNSEFLSPTLKDDAQTALTSFNSIVESKNYGSIVEPLEAFGNIGSDIGKLACYNAEGGGEGKAWLNMRDFVLNAVSKYETLGYLEAGTTQTYEQAYFKVPPTCTNPIMLSAGE